MMGKMVEINNLSNFKGFYFNFGIVIKKKE